MITVLIADDHAVLRQGLRLILQGADDIEVVGEAATGADAVGLHAALQPAVVLMDLQLPDMTGIEATRRIRQSDPAARVLILTVSDRSEDLVAALKAGARGYLLKHMESGEVLAGIRRVAAGDAVLPPQLASRLFDQLAEPATAASDVELTPRELDVFRGVARGLGNKEIAAALNISENTVKTHVRHILGKLNLRSRAEAAAFAVRSGLVGED